MTTRAVNVPRKELEKTLKPLLPSKWRIVSSNAAVDNVKTTIVKLKQQTIERHPTSPGSVHLITFTATIDASEVGSTEAAEDELDDTVNELLHALDGLGLLWTKAQKVADNNRLAYDIDLTITSSPDPQEE
jgi:hypothetical protein